jgi:hypothetical protein
MNVENLDSFILLEGTRKTEFVELNIRYFLDEDGDWK